MRILHGLVVCALIASPACGGGTTTSPGSGPDLTGNWSGLLGQSMSLTALRVTWQASQSGDRATGPATLIKPAANIPANGTLTGTLSGNQVTLTYSAQTGSVTGFPLCIVSGSGSATASGNSITGTLTTTFTACAGTGLDTPSSNQLTLTRQ